MFSHDSLNQ